MAYRGGWPIVGKREVRFRCRLCINQIKLVIDADFICKKNEFPRCYVCGLFMLPEQLDFLLDWMPGKAKMVLEECNSHWEIMEFLYNE